MGSTGRGNYKTSRTGNVNDENFGIAGAVNFKGKIPTEAKLDPVGNNKVTLKVNSSGKQDIIFQFKLRKDNTMSIMAYDPNRGVRSQIAVSSSSPSIERVIRTGSKTESRNALAIKDMMARSTKIDESQLGAIANKLLRNKKK